MSTVRHSSGRTEDARRRKAEADQLRTDLLTSGELIEETALSRNAYFFLDHGGRGDREGVGRGKSRRAESSDRQERGIRRLDADRMQQLQPVAPPPFACARPISRRWAS